MRDCWTINPYRGCSFGCRYCYARYTHEFLGINDPLAFEQWIFVKSGAANALAYEATERKLRARPIAIGTATDPYQPAEGRYELTRGLLEVLARYRGLQLSITTKSNLVVRDLDLLRRIHERSSLSVHLSLVTLDRRLARQLDPGAPSPERRLRTVRTLSDAGLHVGVAAVPILPTLTDDEASLLRLFQAARASGASWVGAGPLFLASASRRYFLDWLRKRRPELVPLYRVLYRRGIDVDPTWRQGLRERIEQIRRQTGVPAHPPHRWAKDPESPPQLTLPGLLAPPASRCAPAIAAESPSGSKRNAS
jgi:DNA repair photolyase